MNQDVLRDAAPAIVLALLVAFGGVIANQNFRYVDVGGETMGQAMYASAGASSKNQYYLAGFPMTYRSTVKRSESETPLLSPASIEAATMGRTQVVDGAHVVDGTQSANTISGDRQVASSFAPIALMVNVFTWVALVVAIIWFVNLVRRWKQQHDTLASRWADAVVAIAILAVPVSFIGFHAARLRFQNATISRIEADGCVYVSTWLPEFLVGQLPSRMETHLRRIHGVSVQNAGPKLLAEIAQLPDLSFLATYGETSMEAFDDGSRQPFLDCVTVCRSRLDESHAEFFRAYPQIVELNLLGGQVDSTAAEAIAEMPNLRQLKCRYGRLPLNTITNPKWANCIETLLLTVGYTENESLEVESWPHLKSLKLEQTMLSRTNPPTRLRISNCPGLQSVALDVLRIFDVKLEDNPRLMAFDPYISSDHVDNQLAAFASIQQFSNLRVKRCASLQRLNFSVLGLENFEVEQCGQLNEVLVSSVEHRKYESVTRESQDIELVGSVLRQLGKLKSLQHLVLQGLPLRRCQLVKPGEFSELRTLSLGNWEIAKQQIPELAALAKLEALKLGTTEIKDTQAEFLLKHFPRLQALFFDGRNLTRLMIGPDCPVGGINASLLPNLEHVSIRSKDLVGGFHVGAKLKSIDINDSPRLTALIIDSPLPKNSQLSGFRDLRTMMVGGGKIDDSVVDSLAACEGLERLMLAYGNLSREALVRLGDFTTLRSLSVPGNQVDDSIIESWSNLVELWSLDLSYNPIGDAALGWASRNESLRYLNLDHTNLAADVVSMLVECNQITHLSLVAVPVTAKQLESILSVCSLDYLNLSENALTDQHLDVLASTANPVEQLVMRRCRLSRQRFADFVSRQPFGKFDVGRMFSQKQIDRMIQNQDSLGGRLLVNGVVNSFHQAQRLVVPELTELALGVGPKPSQITDMSAGNPVPRHMAVTASLASGPDGNPDAVAPNARKPNAIAPDARKMNRAGKPTLRSGSSRRWSMGAVFEDPIESVIRVAGDWAWGETSQFRPEAFRGSEDAANDLANDIGQADSASDDPEIAVFIENPTP